MKPLRALCKNCGLFGASYGDGEKAKGQTKRKMKNRTTATN